MRASSWTGRAAIAATCACLVSSVALAVDPPGSAAKGEKAPPAGGPPPLTLTVVGNQLRITGDPAAVARAYELGRLILEEKGQMYRSFRLQYANATEVADVLEEWFNGPKARRSTPAINPFLALAMRGRGGRGGQPTPPPTPPEPPRIRVVADADNNTLIVRGSALDLVAVQHVLETAIDVEPPDTEAAMKPFIIGPLEYAVATDVVKVIKDVYQQDLDQGTVRGGYRRGRRPTQPLDPSGRPRPVSLTITADDRTNSIIGMAPGRIADGVKKVAGVLEDKARTDKQSVELVPAEGIDPNVLKDVIDAIQVRPPRTVPQRPGQTPLPSRR